MGFIAATLHSERRAAGGEGPRTKESIGEILAGRTQTAAIGVGTGTIAEATGTVTIAVTTATIAAVTGGTGSGAMMSAAHTGNMTRVSASLIEPYKTYKSSVSSSDTFQIE